MGDGGRDEAGGGARRTRFLGRVLEANCGGGSAFGGGRCCALPGMTSTGGSKRDDVRFRKALRRIDGGSRQHNPTNSILRRKGTNRRDQYIRCSPLDSIPRARIQPPIQAWGSSFLSYSWQHVRSESLPVPNNKKEKTYRFRKTRRCGPAWESIHWKHFSLFILQHFNFSNYVSSISISGVRNTICLKGWLKKGRMVGPAPPPPLLVMR